MCHLYRHTKKKKKVRKKTQCAVSLSRVKLEEIIGEYKTNKFTLKRPNSQTLLKVSPPVLPAASEQKSGIKEKRKKAASFQTVSQLHKVTGQDQPRTHRGSRTDPDVSTAELRDVEGVARRAGDGGS